MAKICKYANMRKGIKKIVRWHFIKENMHGLPFYLKRWAEMCQTCARDSKLKVG